MDDLGFFHKKLLSKEEKEGVENYSTLKEAEAQLKTIKPIKLTTENIEKYLKIEVSALDYTTDYRKDPAFHRQLSTGRYAHRPCRHFGHSRHTAG